MATPQVILEFDRVLCATHGEPFRLQWPNGYPTFCIEALQRLLAVDEFAAECGGQIEAINELLSAKPVCCRLPAGALVSLYEMLPFVVEDMCVLCGQAGKGTVLHHKNFWGRSKGSHHTCFGCIAVMRRIGKG
jgi:hypothetical protein